MTTRSRSVAAAAVFLLAAAGCSSKPRGTGSDVSSPKGALVLNYDGAAFEGVSMLFLVLVAADGTKHPLQLEPYMYGALQDCSQCPPDRHIEEHSPTPGGAPPQKYNPGIIARYEGAITKDVVSECAAGGRCIKREAIPPGVYRVELGHKLSCPGSVTVPLAGETTLRCTRP